VLIVIGIVAAVVGVPVGIWLGVMQRRQPAGGHHPVSPRKMARDGSLVVVCAACGHRHGAENLAHAAYLGQRSVRDLTALQRGRLGKRLLRRAISKRILRGLWGN
jgi:hypothetical protein